MVAVLPTTQKQPAVQLAKATMFHCQVASPIRVNPARLGEVNGDALVNCQRPKPGRNCDRGDEKAMHQKAMKVSWHRHQITSQVLSQFEITISGGPLAISQYGSAERPNELAELVQVLA
jgi:hypothetical protein